MIPTVALAATVAGTLDLSDTTSVLFRASSQGAAAVAVPGAVPASPVNGAVSPVGVDLATIPRAFLRLTDRRWNYALSYSPQVWAPDVETGTASLEHPLLFQLATAAVTYQQGSLRISLVESASYGEFNSALLFAPLPTQTAPTPLPMGQGSGQQGQSPPAAEPGQPPVGQPPAFQIVPAQTTVHDGTSNTDLGVSAPLSRRVTLRLGVGYLWGGGLDAQSQVVLPLQFGPRASASVTYAPSQIDRFSTSASGSSVESDGGVCIDGAQPASQPIAPTAECREHAEFATLQETWGHSFSRVLALTVGAGVGVGYTRTETVPITETTSILPTGQLTVIYRFGHMATNVLIIGAQAVPTIDPLTGRVIEPISAALSLADDLTRRVRLRYAMAAGQTVPFDDPASVTAVNGNLAVDFRVARDVTATMGQSLLWQDQRSYGTIFSTSTYVALSVRAQSIRLR